MNDIPKKSPTQITHNGKYYYLHREIDGITLCIKIKDTKELLDKVLSFIDIDFKERAQVQLQMANELRKAKRELREWEDN